MSFQKMCQLLACSKKQNKTISIAPKEPEKKQSPLFASIATSDIHLRTHDDFGMRTTYREW